MADDGNSAPDQRSGRDRRHRDRFYVRLQIRESGISELCELRDISLGGMAVEAPKELETPNDSTILVEIPLARTPSRIRTRCAVQDVTVESVKVLHLRFTDDSEIFKRTLASCLAAWEARPRPDRREVEEGIAVAAAE